MSLDRLCARFALTMLLSLLAVDAGIAGGLPDPKAQKAVVKCQKAIAQAGVKLTTSRLKGLHACTLDALACVQTSSEVAACLGKVSVKCNDRLRTAFPKTEANLIGKIVKACAVKHLRYADLLISDGLGLGNLAPECLADFQLDICNEQSLPTLAGCLIKFHLRTSERLLGTELPRASKLLELQQLDKPLTYLPQFSGCGTCAQPPAKPTGKRVTACGASIAKAGGAYVAKALATLEQCVNGALTCQQSKRTPDCFAKAQSICTKGAVKLDNARSRLAATLEKSCADAPAGALPVDVLQSENGLNLDALVGSCAEIGIPEIMDLDDYAACLQQQHACEVAAVVRSILPRSVEFAAAGFLGEAAPALDDSACAPGPTATSGSSRSEVSSSPRAAVFSVTRFLKLVKTRGGPSVTSPMRSRAPVSTGIARSIRILNGPRRVRPGFGNVVKIAYRGGAGASSPSAKRGALTVGETAPTLILSVQRPDIETDDHFELTLDPVPAGTEAEVEIEIQYADQPPSCVFELAFATTEAGNVSAYTPLEQVVDPEASPEPTSTATPVTGFTATPSPGATVASTATETTGVTSTGTPTPTAQITPTGTTTPTATSTIIDGSTPTPSQTAPSTRTSTPTPIATPTATPTAVFSCAFPASGQTDTFAADRNDGIPTLVPVPDDGDREAGGSLAYFDNGDGTITDLHTGLMWEKKSDDGSLNDMHNAYRWSGDGTTETIWDWLDDLNASGFGGHSDWRIANVRELQSIIDYGRNSPAVHSAFDTSCEPGCSALTCSCTNSGSVWSSTTVDQDPIRAWIVGFSAGDATRFTGSAQNKGTPIATVRAVRDAFECGFQASGQTAPYKADKNDGIAGTVTVPDDGTVQAGADLSFVDNGDGTITDVNTDLMWEKKSDDGGLHDVGNLYEWSGNGTNETIWDWLDDLNASGFAGHSDWRIPNVKELASLADYGESSLAVHPAFDTSCQAGCSVATCSCTASSVWSSTTSDGNAVSAWRVTFSDGAAGVLSKVTDHGVRAVRGGTP